MSRRHLTAVPDPEPVEVTGPAPSWSSYLTADTVGPWLEAMGMQPAIPSERGDARGFRRSGAVVLGEPATPAPGWWVCSGCGRRVDRAGEARTVTARYCTGPEGAAQHRRHAPVAMEVQR